MNDRLMQSQKRLHDSLFELYIDGGLELYLAGTRGLKRDLIIRLETSALTPAKGEIIHFYAVNRWDEDDEFDEWAKPSKALSAEAERILGVTNAQLECCRSAGVVMGDFQDFVETYITASANYYANYRI
jgi:DNA polymerase III alpha subunit (gram-positive type)